MIYWGRCPLVFMKNNHNSCFDIYLQNETAELRITPISPNEEEERQPLYEFSLLLEGEGLGSHYSFIQPFKSAQQQGDGDYEIDDNEKEEDKEVETEQLLPG